MRYTVCMYTRSRKAVIKLAICGVTKMRREKLVRKPTATLQEVLAVRSGGRSGAFSEEKHASLAHVCKKTYTFSQNAP